MVYVFSPSGARLEKLKTKPAHSSDAVGAYLVTALSWGPDSELLAVGQSDAVVFVYRLEVGGKKSICNRIVSSAAVNSLAWPAGSPQTLLCGCTDGKVRAEVASACAAHVRTNRQSCRCGWACWSPTRAARFTRRTWCWRSPAHQTVPTSLRGMLTASSLGAAAQTRASPTASCRAEQTPTTTKLIHLALRSPLVQAG